MFKTSLIAKATKKPKYFNGVKSNKPPKPPMITKLIRIQNQENILKRRYLKPIPKKPSKAKYSNALFFCLGASALKAGLEASIP